MRKLKIFVLLGCLICTLFAITACNKALKTPTGFSVDDNYTMTWTGVQDAHSYKLEVVSVETGEKLEWSTRKNSYSLAKLAEGDYEIRVKALGGGQNATNDSDWSDIINFHKNYETGCIYTLINNNTEYEITKVGTAAGTFTIEDVYRGKPVTRIADAAFKGSGKVVEITVGGRVTEIGDNAFYNCSKLQKVTLPTSLRTLGVSAFQSCRELKEIVIPNSLEVISDYTFAYCRSLEKVTIGNSVKMIGESAFSDCSRLAEITIPDSVTTIGPFAFSANYTSPTETEPALGLKSVHIGSGVQTIGEQAFYKCAAMETLTFAEESCLTSIDKYAFAECAALTQVHLPDGLTSIERGGFYMASALGEVTLPDSVTHVGAQTFNATALFLAAIDGSEGFVYADNWLVGCNVSKRETLEKIEPTTLRTGTVGIADEVFMNCKALRVVELPDSIRYIGNQAFYNNTILGQVKTYHTASGVVSIGDYAFGHCKSLSRLVLGEGLKHIGSYAFYKCETLDNSGLDEESSIIPQSVESIGTYAFKDTKLWLSASGVVYAGNWVVGFNAAEGADMGTVTLKSNVRGIADYAFYQCETLQTIAGLHNAKFIGRGAFYECTNLATVTLNDNLEKISDFTFYKCTALFNVKFPRGLKEIGRSAFYKCETLNEIDLTKTNVETIGQYAFYNCFNIKTVNLGKTLETISDYAFYKCTSIEAIHLSDNVKTIGNRAFYKNESMKELTLGNSVETIGEYAFNGCSSLETLVLPDSVKSLGKSAFYKCVNVSTLTLGNGLETIGDYAFYGMEKITKLTLPESLKTIGKYAFKGCNGLSAVTIGSNVETIGAHAFYGCKGATFYTDVETLPRDWQARWNSSYRPVVWGCELSEEGYVVSVTIGENTLQNNNAKGVVGGPNREGYTFLGWATNQTDMQVVYTAEQLVDVEEGTTLYAVWTETVEAPVETP